MRSPASLLLAALLFSGTACDSAGDNVCEDIGNCSHGGSNDWISSCQDETEALGSEAAKLGCGSEHHAYFHCADSSYSCQGATATFPGCDDELAALDGCLTRATAGSACVRLAMAESACTSASNPDGGPPPACTAARDCQAQCYLGNVANVCAPRVDELEAVTACAASCWP